MTAPAAHPESEAPRRLVDQLAALMRLERVGDDLFRAQSQDIGTPAVFGGQVLGQALMAACNTVEAERPVHSMHAYFLLPGEHAPIDYAVHRARDGRSFTTRHVVARQEGREIFEMTASFQTVDPGIEHQLPMPAVPEPDTLRSELEIRQQLRDRLPERARIKWLESRGIEFRDVEPLDPIFPEKRPAQAALWMRAVAPLPDDPIVHRALLAYASDHGLLRAAMLPHGLSFMRGNVRAASLDHAMWFHRDFRMDDWLLYAIDSPSASGARGLCRGSIFRRDGTLVASTAQEGMLRVRD